ncbi:sulfatase-like hydrolase/transferase [Guptibacillus hwajinpoensis]|uniref:sulfatase-like hydrolase/transferase n=1 Tax=Guptibacillus hwajinpoensis TaxID=208199 RepID=UPI001370DCC0|nr:sulfatase-like hydrolase/transferase [Pseudalkalibacillus hwajinpoensis]
MNKQELLPTLFTTRGKKPNFLIFMVEQQCDPSVYQLDEKRTPMMQEFLLNGFEFKNHYVGSSVCPSSEITLYTGQYPSLHGVTQTSGSDRTQCNSATVPMMADYLRRAGYETYWKGVASKRVVHEANQSTVAPKEKRDEVCAEEVVALLQKLDREDMEASEQWVIFSSFHSDQSCSEMMKVFQTLKKTAFYWNTVILYLSVEGQQGIRPDENCRKNRNNVFEKTIHVPLIIHSPAIIDGKKSTSMLTSHVDILPTMLGLAGIDEEEIQTLLSVDYSEVRPLVGRDLTPLVSGRKRFYRANEPIYFMTGDEGRRGLNEAPGVLVESVLQPNHIEAVVVTMRTGDEEQQEVWKYARYYDDPQYWRIPGVSDVIVTQSIPDSAGEESLSKWVTKTKTSPTPDEFELYNVTRDPLEEKNLAHPNFETPESKEIRKILSLVLEEQRRQKRLTPMRSDIGNVAI